MAFNLVKKGHTGLRLPRNNYVGVYANGGQITFKVSADVISLFGNPKRMRIMIGSGPDAGKALLKPIFAETDDGYKVSRKSEKLIANISVKAKRLLGFSVADMKTVDCKFEVSDDGILIWLPKFETLLAAAE